LSTWAHKKRWQAHISYDGKQHHLGTFDTKQEAALAYDKAARQCGEKKPLNYESIKAAEEPATQAQAEHALAHPKQLKPLPLSGFYGVSAKKRKKKKNGWQATVRYGSKRHHLGTFDTKQEAAHAYDKEARQCGEDMPLNNESITAAEEAAAQSQAEHALTHPKQPKPLPSSGFYGVSASGKRWKAYIYYDSKQHQLGTFDTKQEAALAYDKEAKQCCGEEKPLNLVEDL
jgi:hypothetical protein